MKIKLQKEPLIRCVCGCPFLPENSNAVTKKLFPGVPPKRFMERPFEVVRPYRVYDNRHRRINRLQARK